MLDRCVLLWSQAGKSSRTIAVALPLAALLFWGAWQFGSSSQPQVFHRHDPGEHGGIIVAVGHPHYHVEAIYAQGGVFKLFTLAKDQSQVMSVPVQTITAYVRRSDMVEAVPVTLEPARQSGDTPGQTSAFEGKLPLELVGSQLLVVVPSITMGEGRYRFGFLVQAGDEAEMPRKVTNEAEKQLYLTSGGRYTAADILANGSTTPSQKYRGFQSTHHLHAAPGDRICPITNTKANPKCTWIIDGKRHEFCCPPCIDEFVRSAKEHPESIKEPGAYVQK
jgi:hypothetical protein